MNKNFTSVYGQYFEDYIKIKRKLGQKFDTAEYQFRVIDKLATEFQEKGPGITYEFSRKWAELKPHEGSQSKYNRIHYLKTFSEYLHSLDIETFIPKLPKYGNTNFKPYIFSKVEIEKLFSICDKLKFMKSGTNVNLFAMPLLFRVLYSTGIRRGEAMSLLEKDVNLVELTINIRKSKNGQQRIIPISASLALQCKTYLTYKGNLRNTFKGPNFFFVGSMGGPIGRNSIQFWFKKCINILKMESEEFVGNPRLHDLRHTFAVTSMVKMLDDGKPFEVSFPILAIYLGHSNISSTEQYLRMTDKVSPKILESIDKSFKHIFPQINKSYESNRFFRNDFKFSK